MSKGQNRRLIRGLNKVKGGRVSRERGKRKDESGHESRGQTLRDRFLRVEVPHITHFNIQFIIV